MKPDGSVVDALRRVFAHDAGGPPAPGSGCPDPGRIWDASHGELPPVETREVVKHLRTCASCAAEWRAAVDASEAAALAPEVARARIGWLPLAAAAVAILGIGIVLLVRQSGGPAQPPPFRAQEGDEIRSLVPDGGTLPRDRFLLQWSAVDDEARYLVQVDRQDLQPVASARDLEGTEYLVPAESLADVPSGEALVWRVEARLLDGRRVRSKAFLVRVE